MFVGFKVLASKGIDAPEVFKVLRVFSIGGGVAMVPVAKECARAYPSLRIAINQTKQIHFKFIRCHIVS